MPLPGGTAKTLPLNRTWVKVLLALPTLATIVPAGVTLVFVKEQEATLLVALPALLFVAETLVPRAGSLVVRLSWLKLLFPIM